MKKKIVWLILSCLMVAALVLTSCAPAAVEEEEVVLPEEEEVVEEEVAPPEKGPQYGGTLTNVSYLCAIEPLSWDPADRCWFIMGCASWYLERLLTGDLDRGAQGTGEFYFISRESIPDEFSTGELAESWELTDPTTLVFHIRKGVYWQDKPGVMAARELTADDVAFALNRNLASDMFGPIYLKAWIDSIEATDKYTCVVKMKYFYGNWQFKIGWGYYCLIYPPELVDAGIHDWRNAVGTGPWMLTDYVKGSSRTYERNPNYWGTATIDGKEYQLPLLDRIRLPIIKDESTELAAIRTGKADVYELGPWKFKETLEQTNPELKRFKILSTTPPYIALNYANPLYRDERVVKALSMAINRDSLIDSVYGGDGEVLCFPASPLIGEAEWTPVEKLPESARELFEYNPEKAKQLLAEAGYPNGFKAEIVTASLADWLEQVEPVAFYWGEIGVETAINTMEYGASYGVGMSKTFDHGWYCPKGNCNTFHCLEYHTNKDDAWNPAGYDDPWFADAFFEGVTTETDMAKRTAAMKELNVYLVEHASYIWLPTGYFYTYAWPWVKNYYGQYNVGSDVAGPIYARVWLDQELKKEMGY